MYCEIVFYIIFKELRSYFEKHTAIKELYNGGIRECEE